MAKRLDLFKKKVYIIDELENKSFSAYFVYFRSKKGNISFSQIKTDVHVVYFNLIRGVRALFK